MTEPRGPDFDGATYEAVADKKRLATQLADVRHLMLDGMWRTFSEIRMALGSRYSEASISARLRDLRKDKFGAFEVARHSRGHRSRGLFEYQVRAPTDDVAVGVKHVCRCSECGHVHRRRNPKQKSLFDESGTTPARS